MQLNLFGDPVPAPKRKPVRKTENTQSPAGWSLCYWDHVQIDDDLTPEESRKLEEILQRESDSAAKKHRREKGRGNR